MEITRAGCAAGDLEEYSELFASCFPGARHLRPEYLRWLYRENPAGAMVGFNARIEGHLAAHYACVPASVKIRGIERLALLSLNTATHPDYQGRGLFTRLAEATYQAAADAGIDVVFGVANAKSTQGFVRKLGFQLVAPLESRVGIGRIGRIDWERATRDAEFRRSWPEAELRWRVSNPANPIRTFVLPDGSSGFAAATGRPLFSAWAELGKAFRPAQASHASLLGGPRVFLGAFPKGSCRTRYLRLPERLRPSPLNFIVRGPGNQQALSAHGLLVSFLDFDAF